MLRAAQQARSGAPQPLRRRIRALAARVGQAQDSTSASSVCVELAARLVICVVTLCPRTERTARGEGPRGLR